MTLRKVRPKWRSEMPGRLLFSQKDQTQKPTKE